MMLVHQRAHVLAKIVAQLPKIAKVHLQIVLSKPSSDVLFEVDRLYHMNHPKRLQIEILEAPFNPLEQYERFMELRRWQAERLPRDCKYACIWDDDHILEDAREFKDALGFGFDLCYAEKLFFWNSTKTYTTHIPRHNSVFAYRCLPGDTFPLDRTIHAPVKIHDTAEKIVQLKGRLLDYGYLRALDRDRCWRDYKKVGKIDAATTAIIQQPKLVLWTGPDLYMKLPIC